MADFKRLPSSEEDEGAVRAAQIDALLDDGLDRYFAGRYEDAIHLWTRVLFLDRAHARARAYIERARTALAEMQRRSDELLQASRELLEQGETDAARRLLAEAVAGSGDDVQASTLLVRLERMERVRALTGQFESAETIVVVPRRRRWGRATAVALFVAAGVLVVVAGSLLFLSGGGLTRDQAGAGLTATGAATAAGTGPVSKPALTVLTSSEVALIRARASVAGQRLQQALIDLDRVGPDSPDRPAADQLRIEIQQLLMASARHSSTTVTESIRR